MQRSQGLPQTSYLIPADLEIIPISGEDLKRDGFVVLGFLEFSQYLFEIDDPCAYRKVVILLSKVVIGMDMADSVAMEADELRGSILAAAEIGMADIEGEPNFREGIEDGLEFRRL